MRLNTLILLKKMMKVHRWTLTKEYITQIYQCYEMVEEIRKFHNLTFIFSDGLIYVED